jgi:F0F1-type ATP synthase assembly protein I
MPMNLSISFIVALVVGACIRYGIDSSWFTAIGAGVVIFILTPFVVRGVRERYLIRRIEREVVEKHQSSHRQDAL